MLKVNCNSILCLGNKYTLILINLILLGSLLLAPIKVVSAQTEETRFLLVNNALLAFKVLVPDVPVISSLTANGPDGANLTWSSSALATSYLLEVQRAGSSIWATEYQGSSTSFSVQNLELGNNSFRVSACGDKGCSKPSAVAVIGISVPIKPTINTLTSDGKHMASISWSTSVGAEVYRIEILRPDASAWALQRETASTSVVEQHLLVGNNSFRIVACAGPFCSTPSAIASVYIDQDSDFDGVSDLDDFCSGTDSGDTVNEYGCSSSQINNGGNPGGLAFQCINPQTGATSTDANCPIERRDSDFDGIVDIADEYPLQNATQCLP